MNIWTMLAIPNSIPNSQVRVAMEPQKLVLVHTHTHVHAHADTHTQTHTIHTHSMTKKTSLREGYSLICNI